MAWFGGFGGGGPPQGPPPPPGGGLGGFGGAGGGGMGPPPPARTFQESIEALIFTMGQSAINTNQQLSGLANSIAQGNQRGEDHGYRTLKPKKAFG